MKNLKRNNFLFLILLALICGCQSAQKFKMDTIEKEELNIIEIDTNRIVQECYFMNAEKENQWRHQYILNMLNEKNEVIPIFYPVNQDKSECLSTLKKVEKILKKTPRVKLCAHGRLEKMIDDKSPAEFSDFGYLGKHESPYYALHFDSICNSKECYGISDAWLYTCGSGFKNQN
jgi:hypothetical protein